MCGILGIISKDNISLIEAVRRLKRLEYRGYDSAGLATKEGIIIKSVGDISKLEKKVSEKYSTVKSNVIILHTRWATHGEVNEKNAHPHTDCNNKIFVVHNGTIDNFLEIKEELIKKGHKFKSDTDSEIIAHFFEDRLKEGTSIKSVISEFFDKFRGTFAIVIMFKNENRLIVLKRGSPIVIGLGRDAIYVSSDIYAFIDDTQRVITLDDEEWAEISLEEN